MYVLVSKQIGIEAESIEAGIAAVANGEGATISVSASVRSTVTNPNPTGQVNVGGKTSSRAFSQTTTVPTP